MQRVQQALKYAEYAQSNADVAAGKVELSAGSSGRNLSFSEEESQDSGAGAGLGDGSLHFIDDQKCEASSDEENVNNGPRDSIKANPTHF
jgi:hypothetical protein